MTGSGHGPDPVWSSEPELHAVAVKAAQARGLSAGNAEDVARAAVWLTVRGLGGVEALLAMDDVGPVPSDIVGGLGLDDRLVGRIGPAAVDLAAASPDGVEVRLGPLDAPTLLFGLCGVAAADRGLSFSVVVDSGRDHVIDGDSCRPPPPVGSGELRLTVYRRAVGPGDESASTRSPGDPVAVERAVWDRLDRLAARTYVPSSDRSRDQGAGAGLTDND